MKIGSLIFLTFLPLEFLIKIDKLKSTNISCYSFFHGEGGLANLSYGEGWKCGPKIRKIRFMDGSP